MRRGDRPVAARYDATMFPQMNVLFRFYLAIDGANLIALALPSGANCLPGNTAEKR
jgi:hypothetical protein